MLAIVDLIKRGEFPIAARFISSFCARIRLERTKMKLRHFYLVSALVLT